jgi:pyruvate/2-oxoglutarate dehydrogenase complex dihydrolipoamide acyltransferase (E2) component
MDTFLIDVPMPSMGATVHELTVISLRIQPGAGVKKGQKIAELESDKSVFEFESPCDGTVKAVLVAPGDVRTSGTTLFRIETTDASLRHLESSKGPVPDPVAAPAAPKAVVWTPRAIKLAQEAGLDPTKITDIPATGPGGRVSGDDVTSYLARNKKG